MAMSRQILAKLARNMKQIGLSVTSTSESKVVVDTGALSIGIEYVDAVIQKPMGGVDPSASPFLGIGIANPGKLMMYIDVAGDKTLAEIFVEADVLRVLSMMKGFSNNILVMDGNEGFGVAAVLAELEGHADLLGLGQ